ncbi:MAG: VOC family protein [Acidobacteriaceae bacterium]|nr:VOC family protein [Acidobacteriaceae bacterium]MBV9222627.1 VOC family protein [Acidobacteriaceae bacterium]MBV9306333.1 VOC family protein [Acidobacteriaceae bacterium]MBV9937613.1 VOC family protein [Acidobacteriaceae bacterium]
MSNNFLAHLAHVELLTPKLDESVAFFKTLMGLSETARKGRSVYLRCWGEHYHSSLILTESDRPALGHAAWRTRSAEDLQAAVKAIEVSGTKGEWVRDSVSHGPAYRFTGPGGHPTEIFWEVDWYKAPPDQVSTYPDRPQKSNPNGIAPRQLDHVTVASTNIKKVGRWYCDVLGFRFMATTYIGNDPEAIVFGVITTNEKSHDLGLGIDMSGVPGRLHHLAFWVDTQEDLLRAADVLIEGGFPIEYGPGRHGIGEQSYLYFREPGGLRIEVNTGGYRNYIPDWEPRNWHVSHGSNSMYRNLGMPDSMMEAFPPARGAAMPDADLEPATVGGANPWAKHG